MSYVRIIDSCRRKSKHSGISRNGGSTMTCLDDLLYMLACGTTQTRWIEGNIGDHEADAIKRQAAFHFVFLPRHSCLCRFQSALMHAASQYHTLTPPRWHAEQKFMGVSPIPIFTTNRRVSPNGGRCRSHAAHRTNVAECARQ